MTNNITNVKDAAYYVDSRQKFENLRPEFNRKEDMVNIVLLKVFKKSIEESVMPVGYNIETKHLIIEDGVLVKKGAVESLTNRFCPEMINLDFSAFDENAEMFNGRVFVVGYNKGLARKIYLANATTDTVRDIATNEDIPGSVVYNADGSIKDGVYAFSGDEGCQGSSASQLRKNTITLYANQDIERANRLRSIATYGAADMLIGSLMTPDEEFKFGAARMNQYKSPSSMHDALVNTFAIYCGEWQDSNGNHWFDGGSMSSVDFEAKIFSNDKFKVTSNAILGTVKQIRPFNSKTQSVAVEQALITEFVLQTDAENVFLCRKDITAEDQENFNMLFRKSTKKQSAFYGKNLIITETRHTDLNKIDIYADLNAVKMTHDLRLTSGLNLLDIGKVTHNYEEGVKTSVQPLQSAYYCDPVATNIWLAKKAAEHMDNALNRVLTREPSVPGLEEFEQLYAPTTIPKISPTFALEKHAKLAHTIIDNHIKGMLRDVGTLKFSIAGAYLKIIPDIGMVFANRFLGKGEVYCPAAEEYFTSIGLAKADWYVAMVKFPKMHVLEYGCDRVVSFKELNGRIEASDLNNKQKWLLRRLFKAMSPAVIMMPAIEINKKKLAGMDYDADALQACFDPEFVNILRVKEPLAVNIINDAAKKAEQDLKPFTRNAGWKVFLTMLRNANKSIGEVSCVNNIIVALLIGLLQDKNIKDAQYILRQAFPGAHCIEEYTSPLTIGLDTEDFGVPVQSISDELANKICENIKSTSLTKDNMIAMLLDLGTIERMLQERTIDSAKTNDIVPVPYDIYAIARLLSNEEMELRIKWANGYKDEEDYGALRDSKESRVKDNIVYKVDMEDGLRKKGENAKELYYVIDQFQEKRREFMRKLFETARNLSKINPVFTTAEIDDFKKVATRADIAPLYNALVDCKNMYSDMTGIMNREIIGKKGDEKRLVNEDYKKNIAELSNQVRVLTANLDPVTRAKLLIEVGRNSNFAFTVCPEEYVHFVVAGYAGVDFAGERLDYCDFEVGETVSFVGGLAHTNNKVARTLANLTGDFVIREYAGKKYASKLITELVVVPETNKSVVLFKIHATEVKTAAASITNNLYAGNAITLVPTADNAVMVEDNRITKFHSVANGEVFKMYLNARGTIKRLIHGKTIGKINGTAREVHAVIVAIENVSHVSNADPVVLAAKQIWEVKKTQKANAVIAAKKTFEQFIKPTPTPDTF